MRAKAASPPTRSVTLCVRKRVFFFLTPDLALFGRLSEAYHSLIGLRAGFSAWAASPCEEKSVRAAGAMTRSHEPGSVCTGSFVFSGSRARVRLPFSSRFTEGCAACVLCTATTLIHCREFFGDSLNGKLKPYNKRKQRNE